MSTSPLETTLSNSTLRNSTLRKSGLAAGAASAQNAGGMPLAFAAPTAAPPSDSEGYVNSTARCSSPDTAVLFGTTGSSRVAICKTADGAFEYRGVRVSDGAKLIAPAKQTSTSTFVVNNDGVKYTITPTALSVTANGDTFRTETWSDFHGPEAPASSSSSGSTSPSKATSPATSPATATAEPSTSPAATPSTSAPAASSAVPLPPLPAEVGGGSSSVE
jgi:hypothetical protein